MRLRNIPGCEEYLESAEKFFVVAKAENQKQECFGKWKDIFGNDNDIHAEFGTGRGKFIAEMALNNPDINYIGVEMKAEALYKAVKKAEKLDSHLSHQEPSKTHLPNLKYLLFNVDRMEEAFDESELSRIYLNFVDPWHKYKHRKRRLTHKRFLDRFAKILKDDGEVHFKTDNRPLFEFSLNEFASIDLKMKNISLDLVNSKFEGNVTTEYEDKFMSKGNPIFRVEVETERLK
jgi:tRNA (guanine-N7-)-methyltransferase